MSWTRCSINGNKVMPVRCAHSSIPINSKTIYLFGGWDGTHVLDDLIKFNIETSHWDFPLPIVGKRPSKRAGHSGTPLPNGNSFLIFGGSDGEHYTNEVFIFDCDKMQWNEIHTTGTIPQPRSRHTATLVDNKIYIFGGSDGHRSFNSLYVLDLNTTKWSIPNCIGGTPPATWGHSSILYQNKIYFYGGCTGDSMSPMLNILDLSNHEWKVNVKIGFDTTNLSSSSSSVAVGPLGRAGHSFTLYKDRFILFGGGSDNDKILNDTFVLNTTTLVWKKFIAENTPTLRCAHTAEIVNNKIYIFGGSDGKQYFKDIAILDADKVLLKIEQVPKKRIRMRPFKTASTANTEETTEEEEEEEKSTSTTTTSSQSNNTPTIYQPPKIITTPPTISVNSKIIQTQPIKPQPIKPQPNGSIVINKPVNNNNHNININNNSQHINNNPPPPQPAPSRLKKAATPTPSAIAMKDSTQQKQKELIEWLTKLNLSKYENHFLKNGMTLDVLDYLTEQHLVEDLKIPTLGARLRILNSIQLEKAKLLNGKKVKDEKEIIKESIESLKHVADSLSASIQSLNISIKESSHSNNVAGHVSPSILSMNGRSRRGSNAFEHPIK